MFCFVIFISILPSTIYGKNKNGSRDEEKPMYQGVFTAPFAIYRCISAKKRDHVDTSSAFQCVCVCVFNKCYSKERKPRPP